MKSLSDCHLYGILDLGYVSAANLEETARRMLDGGVDILQLRAKGHATDAIRALADRVLPVCRTFDVPMILNDHPELVPLTGADGVHVGQDDMPVPQVRALVGPQALVGLSTHSLAQAEASAEVSPDYIGFGPLFSTPTKPDYVAIGLDEIRAAHERARGPIFCIGGIKRENLPTVLAAGARRVVIVSGILQAADVSGYCRQCRALLS
jgi:thiamine-phosphate pyrophosphorylase